MLRYECLKCGADLYTADGQRAIRCPYCSEPIHEAGEPCQAEEVEG